MATLSREAIAPYLAPIPGEDPCGLDERHSHPYMEAENEAKKLGGIHSDPVDWEKLLDLSEGLLKSNTKDLKLAGCMTLARYHLEGIHGLNQGLQVVVALLEEYWDHVHPKPRSSSNLRRRASPLIWLNTNLQKILLTAKTTPNAANAFSSILATTQKYESICVDRFGSQTPAFRDLLTAIEQLNQESLEASAAEPSTSVEAPSKEFTKRETNGSQQSTQADPTSLTNPDSQDNNAPHSALAHLLSPINDQAPSGSDERYSASYEQVRLEIDKLDNQLSDQQPDWEIVSELSCNLLEQSTKDLNLAAFITLSRFERNQLSGLCEGYWLVIEMIERFWEDVFPLPRSPDNFKRRATPLRWLSKHVETRLESYQVSQTDGPEIAELKKAIERFSRTTQARFGQSTPPTRQLLEKVKHLAILHDELTRTENRTEEDPPVEPQPEEQQESARANGPQEEKPEVDEPVNLSSTATKVETPSVEQAPSDLSDAMDYLSQTGDSLCTLSRKIREASPHDPLSYRLHRQALWLYITEPPPRTRGNRTGVPPLPATIREQLDLLTKQGTWDTLLESAESALDGFRFCLDLHRHVVVALQALGSSSEAIETIKGELTAFLRRMPTLIELESSDGTPLADAETKEWVRREVLRGSSERPDDEEPSDEHWWEPISQALAAANPNKIIASVQYALVQAPDQIQFAKRALKAATEVRSVPGLSMLLTHLAHDGLTHPNGNSRPMDANLEAKCLKTILRFRGDTSTSSALVVKKPHLLDSALSLGHCNLAEALPYFTPSNID